MKIIAQIRYIKRIYWPALRTNRVMLNDRYRIQIFQPKSKSLTTGTSPEHRLHLFHPFTPRHNEETRCPKTRKMLHNCSVSPGDRACSSSTSHCSTLQHWMLYPHPRFQISKQQVSNISLQYLTEGPIIWRTSDRLTSSLCLSLPDPWTKDLVLPKPALQPSSYSFLMQPGPIFYKVVAFFPSLESLILRRSASFLLNRRSRCSGLTYFTCLSPALC